MKKLLIVLAAIGIVLFLVSQAHAVSLDKVTLCHKTGSLTNPWVKQTVAANEVQSHLANGDFLITKETPCPPVVTPTVTPTEAVTETPTETVTETPTVGPTETPTTTPSTGAVGGDNRSDGLGCGSHDCSTHVVVPQSAPATGRAL